MERAYPSHFDAFAAGFAGAAIALHDAAHVRAGRPWDVLWLCNLSALCLPVGLWYRAPSACQVSLTWLLPGTLVWLLDAVLAGANLLPTSWNVHVGGLLLAAYGVARNGRCPQGWAFALALPAGAFVLARVFTSPVHNVNAAFGAPQGWGFLGASMPRFALASVALLGLCTLVGELLTRGLAALGGRVKGLSSSATTRAGRA